MDSLIGFFRVLAANESIEPSERKENFALLLDFGQGIERWFQIRSGQ
jgi:hypothetical protein